jgi:transcriptional accessory protein Tex/SPT6
MHKFGSQHEGVENEKNLVDKYVDFEMKLSSCLQHHRLALFKPRILALALISLELEKQQVQEPEMNIDWLASISYLQQLAKVNKNICFFPIKFVFLFRSKAMLYCHVEI